MIPSLRRLGAALAVSLPFLASGALPAAADTVQSNATLTITDKGISPSPVTVTQGGSVTFINNGTTTHTATSGSAPISFDTGGIDAGKTSSLSLALPGTYTYTSAIDCLGGNNAPGFNCGPYTIIVSTQPANSTVNTAPAAAAAPVVSSSAPPTSASGQNVAVTISDTGFAPTAVSIPLGGNVTFTNSGSGVHTATTTGTPPVSFDTGGLSNGQSNTLTFATPGTYAYTSATDCVNGNNAAFKCSAGYTVTVSSTPGVTAPVPVGPVAGVAPPVVVQNGTVTLTENDGFSPNTVTIQHGATVTWTNRGTKVHTVSSNPGYYNTFDSGGLDPGKSFSYNFTIPGTYGYHSQTEPQYSQDPNNVNSTLVTYSYNGTVIVQ